MAAIANGEDTFDAIKKIISKGTLEDEDVYLLLLAGLSDLNDKITRKRQADTRADDKRDAEQKIINGKVDKMWFVYKVNIAILIFFASAVGTLLFSLLTDKITVVATG